MVCRKLLIEQRKSLIFVVGAFLGFNLIMGLWTGWATFRPGSSKFSLYIFIAGLACTVAASKMMWDMTDKQGRTALLMTPAPASYKFLSRLIVVFPGMIILTVIGYFIYNYSMILANGVTHNVWPDIYNPFASWGWMKTVATCLMSSLFVFTESLFIFGAVAWPRKSFLKTLGLIVVLQIILSFIGVMFSRTHLQVEVYNEKAFIWSLTCVWTLISAVIIYLSYLKFKKSTVI